MVRRSPYLPIFMLGLELSVWGCTPISWTRVTLNHSLRGEDVAFITPGVTKWDEVISRLGAPNDLSETLNGVVATYYYYDSKRFHIDFGYPLGFIPQMSYVPHQMEFNNAGIGGNRFQVAFDVSGTVLYDSFSRLGAAPKFKASPFESAVPR